MDRLVADVVGSLPACGAARAGGKRALRNSGGLVGARKGQVFGGEFGRQDLDHRLVLEPDLDHVEPPAVAAEALPALTARDRFHGLGIGGDAKREMRRAVAARFLLYKARTLAAARPKLGSRRIDFDT